MFSTKPYLMICCIAREAHLPSPGTNLHPETVARRAGIYDAQEGLRAPAEPLTRCWKKCRRYAASTISVGYDNEVDALTARKIV